MILNGKWWKFGNSYHFLLHFKHVYFIPIWAQFIQQYTCSIGLVFIIWCTHESKEENGKSKFFKNTRNHQKPKENEDNDEDDDDGNCVYVINKFSIERGQFFLPLPSE